MFAGGLEALRPQKIIMTCISGGDAAGAEENPAFSG
jgi:hypothetical protein